MNLLTRIYLLFLTITLLLITAVTILQYREHSQVKQVKDQLVKRNTILLENHIKLKSKPISSYLTDISIWNDMVKFTKTGNRNFAYENFDISCSVFKINQLWVFNESARKIYSFKNSSRQFYYLDESSLNFSEIINEIQRFGFIRCYAVKGSSVFEIFGSSIHNTSDRHRKTTPSGYIIASIEYNHNYIYSILTEIPSIVSLKVTASETDKQSSSDYLNITIPLTDLHDRQVAAIRAEFEASAVKEASTSGFDGRLMGLFTLLSLIIILFVFRRWVIIPLKKIYNAMRRQEYIPDEVLQNSSNDFLQIANLINKIKRSDENIKKALAEAEEQRGVAEKATKAKGEFLASMSHEIRTPMTGVMGFSDMLMDTPLAENQKYLTEGIHKSAESILGIINDILDLSKIEAGKFNLNTVPFDLNDFLKNIVWMFGSIAAEKDLELVLDNRLNNDCIVSGDEKRLRQILVNIIGNSIKFTKKGTIKLIAETSLRPDGMNDFTFKISDTGIGMTEEQVSRIYEKYEQVHDPVTSEGGSGLGLSITRTLLNLMKGHISVESRPQRGTTFTVTIPLTPNQSCMLKTSEDTVPQFDLKILVAEDNMINMKVIENFLKKSGCTTVMAENGMEAIEKLKEEKFDIIFMDCLMPILDGFEAAKQIRAEIDSAIPIIAISADIMEETREKCTDAGMNDFLMKPYRRDDVIRILKKWG